MKIKRIRSDSNGLKGSAETQPVEAEIFDAYSQAVIHAVERAGSAVVSVGLAMRVPEQLKRRGVPEIRSLGSEALYYLGGAEPGFTWRPLCLRGIFSIKIMLYLFDKLPQEKPVR